MTIDPVAVSVSALAVAVVSLLITTYRASVDRRLQWEQVRGRAHARLTSRGVDLLTIIEDLRRFEPEKTVDIIQKLIRVAQGVVKMRTSLKTMKRTGWLFTSYALTEFAPIMSDLDDADIIFEMLRRAVQKSDLLEARKITDGLLERFYGAKKGPREIEPTSKPGNPIDRVEKCNPKM